MAVRRAGGSSAGGAGGTVDLFAGDAPSRTDGVGQDSGKHRCPRGGGPFHQELPHSGAGDAVLPVPERGLRPACGQNLEAGNSPRTDLIKRYIPSRI